MADDRPRSPLTVSRILLAYVVLAVAWIALSDRVAGWMFPRTEDLVVVQTVKGWAFVATTSLLLAGLLARYEHERERERAAVAQRERMFRLLAERARDVIFRFRVAPTPGVDYVSRAIETSLGYPIDAFFGDPAFIAGLVHPEDQPIFPIDASSVPDTALTTARLRAADGTWVPFEIHIGRAPVEPDGVVAIEGVARDVTDRVHADQELNRLNRILRTLSAANRALVRAGTELDLLETTCRAIVDEGGFRFAWVGQFDSASRRSRPVAHAGYEVGYLATSPAGNGDVTGAGGPVGTAVRTGRPVVSRDIERDPAMAPWRAQARERGYASMAALPLIGRAGTSGTIAIYADVVDAFGPDEVALLEELAADLAFGLDTLRDRAAHGAREADRRRLATAVAQSSESIVITDAEANIQYVNPAFERLTGFSRDEVVGRNPRVLKSGVQSSGFYAAMWQTLAAGRPWISDMVNRRKDGSLFTEEAVISPVVDAAGEITGYVAVKRDVTRERAAEVRARAQTRERVLISDALAALRPENSPEQTAMAICQQLSRLPEATAAWLLVFDSAGHATLLAGVDGNGMATPLERVGETRTAELLARAETGPWVERRPDDAALVARASSGGTLVQNVAYAPVRVDGDVVGLLGIGSSDLAGTISLTERLPALVEFAGIAGAVLGPSISRHAETAIARARILRVIEGRDFRPVYQPIVDLERRDIRAAEALTRFADGVPPDVRFEEAARIGLGLELEAATLEMALDVAATLPASVILSVNVSPTFVLTPGRLAGILERHRREITLEVTEHEAIGDYGALRAAVAQLGGGVRLAVDDAGAGFASMRHVLELRPAMVKIDRSLVAGIDRDPARQALLAGFRHLADSIGCQLIAEGIETEPELAALRDAGLTLGQGFLLGRPAPIGELPLGPRQSRPAGVGGRTGARDAGVLGQRASSSRHPR